MATVEEKDAILAQLLGLGFDFDLCQSALETCSTVEAATDWILTSQNPNSQHGNPYTSDRPTLRLGSGSSSATVPQPLDATTKFNTSDASSSIGTAPLPFHSRHDIPDDDEYTRDSKEKAARLAQETKRQKNAEREAHRRALVQIKEDREKIKIRRTHIPADEDHVMSDAQLKSSSSVPATPASRRMTTEAERIAQDQKRQRAMDREAHRRALLEIKADREAQRNRSNHTTSASAQPLVTSSSQTPPDTALIQIRFPDGSSVRQAFPAVTKLEALFELVAKREAGDVELVSRQDPLVFPDPPPSTVPLAMLQNDTVPGTWPEEDVAGRSEATQNRMEEGDRTPAQQPPPGPPFEDAGPQPQIQPQVQLPSHFLPAPFPIPPILPAHDDDHDMLLNLNNPDPRRPMWAADAGVGHRLVAADSADTAAAADDAEPEPTRPTREMRVQVLEAAARTVPRVGERARLRSPHILHRHREIAPPFTAFRLVGCCGAPAREADRHAEPRQDRAGEAGESLLPPKRQIRHVHPRHRLAARCPWQIAVRAGCDEAQLEGVRRLRNLEHLDLSNCKVSDRAVPTLAKFATLQSLALAKTKITTAGLCKFATESASQNHLRSLSLEGCLGVGGKDVFASLENLTALIHLNLSSTSLQPGQKTSALRGAFAQLETLDVSKTQLIDKDLVRVVCGFREMRELNLTGCPELGREGLIWVAKELRSLTHVHFPNREHELDDTLVQFAHLPLTHLDLTGFLNVTDEGAHTIAQMKTLEYLGLEGTKITDVGMEGFKDLNELRELYLDRTSVSDVGIQHILGLAHLQTLSTSRTGITNASLIHISEASFARGLRILNMAGCLINLVNLNLDFTNVSRSCLRHLEELPLLQPVRLMGITLEYDSDDEE
ncbi:hypothetical protein BC936DRAFT_145992 [Jimgerdemannia flammicorona]|uniref:UBX domain-containing protein n=1 Tax=Jimgerdemannia flammicorona TaxID=994334 RepID=A0A433D8M2_9FUNG|nr:hypothetical protein BC936DRAFT_145992 [Jimgerdemannia flammicorona]